MNRSLILLTVLLSSCGKSAESNDVCQPQDVAIAKCIVKEYKKNPNQLMLEIQKETCERRYPINMCYYE